jgi:type I restriction enzyme S subunit
LLEESFAKIADQATWTPLGAALEHITSGSRDWSQYYGKGSAVFVLAGNIRPMAFDPTPKQYVNPPRDGADARRTRIERDDLLVTIVGNAGDVCRVDVELNDYYVCQSVAIVRLRNRGLSRFIELFFNTSAFGRGEILSAAYGQGRQHLGFDDLKAIKVPIVDDNVADDTVRRVEPVLESIAAIADQVRRSRILLERLEDRIRANAVSGGLPLDGDAIA